MVRSSISERERRAWYRVLGLGFVLLVGGSAGLMALAGGASAAETAGVSAFGLATGGGLLWYVSTLSLSEDRDRSRRDR